MSLDLRTSLRNAESFLRERRFKIPVELSVKMRRTGVFPRPAVKQGGYDAIRATYWAAIYDAVYNYLSSDQRSTSFKSDMKQALVQAFTSTADAGYTDGGGELPMDEETSAWLTDQQGAELANVDTLFQSLKLLRDEPDTDALTEAFARADGYCNTLDWLYNQARLYGLKNEMLTFTGNDGKESCDTCQSLKGQRHRASWYIAHDVVPPSGDGLDCAAGGHCMHHLEDDQGNQITI